MKGIMKRFSIMFASLAMVFSAGLIHEETNGAKAAGIDDYTKITDVSSLVTGDKVVLYCDAKKVGVTGQSTKDATVSATESEWVNYEVEVTGSNFTLFDPNKNNYIASPTANAFTYTPSSSSAGKCTVNSNGAFSANNRYLCANGSNYRMYLSSSINKNYSYFYVYKTTASSTVLIDSITIKADGIETDSIDLNLDDMYEGLTYEVSPSNPTDSSVTWSSTDDEIAYYEDGIVYAVGVGNATLTVTANDAGKAKKEIIVNVIDPSTPQLKSITVSGNPKTPQYVGNDFDYEGLTFTPVYDKDNDSPESITGDMITWPTLTAGMTSIKGIYKNIEVLVEGVEVIEDTIQSISISGEMEKKTYYQNDTFDFNGLEVTAIYKSGKEEKVFNLDVTWTSDKELVNLVIGEENTIVVTAEYSGLTASININGIIVLEALNTEEVTFDFSTEGISGTRTENAISISRSSDNTYKAPLRIYKSTIVTIEADDSALRILKIEINVDLSKGTLDDNKNASAWSPSYNNADVDSTVIILEFETSSKTIKYTAPNQVRWNSMKVTYEKVKSDENKKVESIELSSSYLELEEGNSSKLLATVLPVDAADTSITWSSSKETIATVSSDGMVTALSVGETVIKAVSNDGSNIEASCTVSVSEAPYINYSPDSSIKSDTISSQEHEFFILRENEDIYHGFNANYGAQFGTGEKAAGTIKFISRNTSFDRENLKLKINSTFSGDGPATLKVYFGAELLGEEDLIKSTATEFTFNSDSATSSKGSITIVLENQNSAVYLKSIKVYGTMTVEDDAVQLLTNKLSTLDTCSEYSKASELRSEYNALTDDEKRIFEKQTITDQDENGKDVTINALDKLAYMELLEANSKQNNANNNMLSSISNKKSLAIILIIGLLGLSSIAGYYFINKKRLAK